MCTDGEFDPDNSELIYGPINKPRWIYACAKQLMDRVIAAYGQQEGLDYTLFRPFNWIGAGLDSIHTPKEGSSRVITQFFGHIVRGEAIKLVDGGHAETRLHLYRRRHRCADENHRQQERHRQRQNLQYRQPAQQLLGSRTGADDDRSGPDLSRVPGCGTPGQNSGHHGRLPITAAGYQDVQNRVPKIDNTRQDLGLGAGSGHENRAEEHFRCLSQATLPKPAESGELKHETGTKDRCRHLPRHAQGVPRLVEMLKAQGAGATFLFSLGPDHTGRAIKRDFPAGFLRKVRRTSVLEHYGIKTLLYGTLLPGPDIGRRCADIMRDRARCRVRSRHPHLGPRAVAGPGRPTPIRSVDATADGRSPASASRKFSANRRGCTAPPAGR